MYLGELIYTLDSELPFWVQTPSFSEWYEDKSDFLEHHKGDWDLDDDAVDYITIDGDGVLTIEVRE